MKQANERFDVVIVGAGLAGLSLARQILLERDKRILLVERRQSVPPQRQKVGEATVQVSGYYFSKVLDLEEHLFLEHFMKYNLRFHWKTAGRSGAAFEDYHQSYIRGLSNIASYQLDRNRLEAELLRLNLAAPSFFFAPGAKGLDISLSEDDAPHRVTFDNGGGPMTVDATWVVDTTGRNRVLAKQLGLERQNQIRHGSTFFWVDGLVDIEKLTDLSPREIRLKKDRTSIGHLPFWLATNHFAGEGYWFWVIPLQGKTSLGLVYDTAVIPAETVSSAEKTIEWICREFPLFARDLPNRKITSRGFLPDFSYDCAQTISNKRWALTGESGRFTDPLYSPGGDLISLYNTLVKDAILADDPAELERRCKIYEPLMRAFYEAYIPSYEPGYVSLGDAEVFSLKYTWELTIYFGFYVFPFINDLFTDLRFVPMYLMKFARLGRANKNLQKFLAGYYGWKKAKGVAATEPVFHDFTELGPLKSAEMTFYRTGVGPDEAKEVLEEQLENLQLLAKFIVAHVWSVVLDDPRAVTSRDFVAAISIDTLEFDADRARASLAAAGPESFDWPFPTCALRKFHKGMKADMTMRKAEMMEKAEMTKKAMCKPTGDVAMTVAGDKKS